MRSFAKCVQLGLSPLLDKYPLQLKVKRDSDPIAAPGRATLVSEHCRIEIFLEHTQVGILFYDLKRNRMYEASGFVASQDPTYWLRNEFYCIDVNDKSQCIHVFASVSEMLIKYFGDVIDGTASEEKIKRYIEFAAFKADSNYAVINLPDSDPIKIKMLAYDYTWVEEYKARLASKNENIS